jgi:hypothetical protein
MFTSMRWFFVLSLLVGVAHGNEVARVLSSTGPVSVFRNFEQIFLSKNSRVLRKDLIKTEKGVLELSCGESRLLTEGPAGFQLQRKNRHVEVTLYDGRVLLDCRKGEGWELRSGSFIIKGTGGVFHIAVEKEGLEVACLKGSDVEYSLNGSRGGVLQKGDAGRLDLASNKIQYPRKLTEFEIQVYSDSLVGSVVQAGEMLLDLDGKPFAPLGELQQQESDRRKQLLSDSLERSDKTGIRERSLGKLEKEFDKNLEEVVDDGVGFSFPVPLSPIPSP